MPSICLILIGIPTLCRAGEIKIQFYQNTVIILSIFVVTVGVTFKRLLLIRFELIMERFR